MEEDVANLCNPTLCPLQCCTSDNQCGNNSGECNSFIIENFEKEEKK